MAPDKEGDRSKQRLAHFEIERELGRGGMGVVYLARDQKLGREVALKVLPAEVAQDPERRQRFLREARSAAAVHHPNIATIFEIGESDGQLFIAMERVEGESLRRILADGALPIAKAVHIATEIATALDKAHRAGVVHRDLKPENVVVTPDGHAKLLDFGIAKALTPDRPQQSGEAITATGQILGTAGYMAPEQTTGRPTDHRVDVFALGVVLYEMLSGRSPFGGDTPLERAASVLRDEPPSLETLAKGVPAELDAVLRRCLAKRPDERFASAADVVARLRDVDVGSPEDPKMARAGSGAKSVDPYAPTMATPAGSAAAALSNESAATAPRTRRSLRSLAWIGGGVSVLALGAGAVALLRWPSKSQPAARTTRPDVAAKVERSARRKPRARKSPRAEIPALFQCGDKAPDEAEFGFECEAPRVSWCDVSWNPVGCCAKGLVALDVDGTCGCPPGGATDPEAIEAGCRKAEQPKKKLSGDAIRRVVREHYGEFRACYESALSETEKPRGKVSFALRISPSGKVFSVRIQGSSLPAPDAQRCLLGVWRKLEFPPPAGTSGVTVVYPLSFSPG